MFLMSISLALLLLLLLLLPWLFRGFPRHHRLTVRVFSLDDFSRETVVVDISRQFDRKTFDRQGKLGR